MTRPLPDPNLPWPLPMAVIAEIADDEGLRLKAYRCPAGVWTIGWGETDGVRPGDACTKEQADQWLLDDVTERVRAVREMCTFAPSMNELGAMVRLAYNIGLEGLRGSTVLRQHNAGNRQAAARAFALWNKRKDPATGQLVVDDALTARRAREAARYLTPDDEAQPAPMPQAVEAESSLVASPIARSGAGTIGAGVLVAAAQVSDSIEQAGGIFAKAKDTLASVAGFVGIPPALMLAAALVAIGVVVVRQRRKQRLEGWA